MNRTWRVIPAILILLVLIAGAAILGGYAYNAGIARGLLESGELAGEAAGAVPFYGPFFYPWGFGFFGLKFLGCLFPLLFIFLAFGLFRGMFWGRRWGWGGAHKPWDRGYPPMFDEWHRRAHGEGGEDESESQPPVS